MHDIMVFGKSEAEHEAHLTGVPTLLRENEFYAKVSECFFESETRFFEHVVRAQGFHSIPRK